MSIQKSMQVTLQSQKVSGLNYTLQSGTDLVSIELVCYDIKGDSQIISVPLNELEELVEVAKKQGFLKKPMPEGPVPR